MAEKLKPCPFCGGEARMVLQHNDDGTWVRYYVCCYACGSKTKEYKAHEIAHRAWNRRAGDSDETD